MGDCPANSASLNAENLIVSRVLRKNVTFCCNTVSDGLNFTIIWCYFGYNFTLLRCHKQAFWCHEPLTNLHIGINIRFAISSPSDAFLNFGQYINWCGAWVGRRPQKLVGRIFTSPINWVIQTGQMCHTMIVNADGISENEAGTSPMISPSVSTRSCSSDSTAMVAIFLSLTLESPI